MHSPARSLQRLQQPEPLTDLYESFSKLCFCHVRSYHASPSRRADPLTLSTKSPIKDVKELRDKKKTPEQIQQEALKRAKEQQKIEEDRARTMSQRLGTLASNSLFAGEAEQSKKVTTSESGVGIPQEYDYPEDVVSPFSSRNPANMAVVLNPRPNARARWQRRMVIRDIRRRGRLTKAMQIARTERSHLSRSHFFKTSMKKLAPLARQIAGKSIDEAITQMRFSNKKAAIDVRQHLIAARNEAIVARGMGIPPQATSKSDELAATASKATEDPSITPPLPTQRADRGLKRLFSMPDSSSSSQKVLQNQTDIYIAEAWTNRGPYGAEADYRAKGRVNMMRPPYTGLSVLLKEEKTRTREKQEKEAKAIRKRMGKNMWTQLPDRPVVRQSQLVLW